MKWASKVPAAALLLGIVAAALSVAPARADVVTDWNVTTNALCGQRRRQQPATAHLGDGACRHVRCDQYGAEPLRARGRDRSGRRPALRRRRRPRRPRGRSSPRSTRHRKPRSKRRTRHRLRRSRTGPPRPKASSWVWRWPRRSRPTAPNDGTNAPDTYRPHAAPGAYVPTAAAGVGAICAREAMGAQERRPVPARPAAGTVERGVGPRLQRGEEPRRHQEHGAHP